MFENKESDMTDKEKINIGLIGHKFMGRLHTHGYTNVPAAFELKQIPVKKIICGLGEDLPIVAKKWGWDEWTDDWKKVVSRNDIDVIDIAAPSIMHREIAIAAAQEGKHIFCEKPLAMNLSDAREMVQIVKDAGVVNTVGFNYRKAPAIGLAKQLIEKGKIGRIFHFRGMYSQDWLVDPSFPLAWRLRKDAAGGGSSWDLGAHVVDLARFLVGEIEEVIGFQSTFVKERPIAEIEDGLTAIAGKEKGKVDVDDATSFLLRFENGAMGIIEVTRFGTGHRNENRIEIYGSEGGLMWNGFEKQNELLFYSRTDEIGTQGYRAIQMGEGVHPYGNNWWPVGHTIGFGETFVHEIHDFLVAIGEGKQISPSFEDGLRCQEILTALDESIAKKAWMKVKEI